MSELGSRSFAHPWVSLCVFFPVTSWEFPKRSTWPMTFISEFLELSTVPNAWGVFSKQLEIIDQKKQILFSPNRDIKLHGSERSRMDVQIPAQSCRLSLERPSEWIWISSMTDNFVGSVELTRKHFLPTVPREMRCSSSFWSRTGLQKCNSQVHRELFPNSFICSLITLLNKYWPKVFYVSQASDTSREYNGEKNNRRTYFLNSYVNLSHQ